MSDDFKTHVTDMNVWMRLLFMLLFAAIYAVTRLVLVVVVILQFMWVLFTADKNRPLLSFGSQLSTFVYQIYRYLTFNTECRPFPFADWPDDAALITGEQETAVDVSATQKDEVKKACFEDSVDAASESGIEADDTATPVEKPDARNKP